MIKTIWSTHYKCWVAVDDDDILAQKKGISKANAIARLRHASAKFGFRLTTEDIRAMRSACTPTS